MSKSKKSSPEHEKGLLDKAAEAMHSLGEAVVEGKDKLVAATVETFTDVKEAVQKKFAKKKTLVKKAAKTVVKKAAPKKKVTAAKKALKKIVKKAAPKKAAKATKKAVKKIIKKAAPKKKKK